MPRWVNDVPAYEQYKEDMLALQPDLYKELYEMQAVLDVAAKMYRDLMYCIILARQNQYVSRCDLNEMVQNELFYYGKSTVTAQNLEDHREELLALMRGYGKISKTYLENIVQAFSGLQAEVTFDVQTLTVSIAVRASYDRSIPTDAIAAIVLKRIPAHLAVSVFRMFTTWDELETNFTWAQAKAAYTWHMLKNEKVV